jgi:hypothetical protein
MTQCEPMTSYHFTGNEIDNTGQPEWGSGYPGDEMVMDGGRRSVRRSVSKTRNKRKKNTIRRANRDRTRQTTRRMAASSRRRSNKVKNMIKKSIKYQRTGKRRPGKAISYRQGRVKKTRYGRDSRGRSLARKGVSPNKNPEKIVKGAVNQKRPSASYYYNVLNKPVGTKIYYRPKKSGKEVLHVLQIRKNGVPYWKSK